MTDWIKEQRAGPFSLNSNQPTSNVFIADFIELNDFEFPRTVIALNDKLFIELNESNNESDNIHNENDKISNEKSNNIINS